MVYYNITSGIDAERPSEVEMYYSYSQRKVLAPPRQLRRYWNLIYVVVYL